MRALKDDGTLDIGNEEAWMWIWAAAWTFIVAIAAAMLVRTAEGDPSGVAFLVGGLVGAISTIPMWAIFSVAAKALTGVAVMLRRESVARDTPHDAAPHADTTV